MESYFALANGIKDEVKNWLKSKGIKERDKRFLSDDDKRGEEPEGFYWLKQDLLPALGYKGKVEEFEADQFSRFMCKWCKGETEAGRCSDCSECHINDAVMEIQDSFQMDPGCIADEEKPEFFKGLIDAVEDWLVDRGFLPEDIPNKDRDAIKDEDDPGFMAIIYGKDYESLADAFAEVLGIER